MAPALITSSNVVGCSTGRSAGLAPLTSMTMRYQHLSPGHLRDAIRTLDEARPAPTRPQGRPWPPPLAHEGTPVRHNYGTGEMTNAGCAATPRQKWWTILDLNQ